MNLSGQWPYVIAAYGLGVGAIGALTGWSWLTMRRAESRRDRVLGRGKGAR